MFGKGRSILHYATPSSVKPLVASTILLHFYDRIIHCDIEIVGDTLVVTNKTNGYIMDITFSQNAEFTKVTFSVLRNFVLE